ncbi:unnamed protein product, partial [Rotaria sordida]
MDETGNREWSKKYTKVKDVVTELDTLIYRIEVDHKIQKIIEQPLSINIFTAGKSTDDVNGKFVYSQVLIDCLLRLKTIPEDAKELIQILKQAYEDNRFESSNIQEFRKKYSSDQAVWWYTRDTFFYKALNAVLRTENIHMIFLFRTYIFDIQRQLKTHQAKKPLRVYRGQVISIDELKTLQNSCGQFISVNSFFSTSTNDERARSFLNAPNTPENLEKVLFDIVANPKAATTKPFADIRTLSEFPGESEILFMIGSIFRLNSVNRSAKDQIWIIEMTLCSENEHDLQEVLINEQNWFRIHYKLYFLCECSHEPNQMHVAPHEGYLIRMPRDFVVQYAPYLRTTLNIVRIMLSSGRFVLSKNGSALPSEFNTPEEKETIKQQLNLVEALINKFDNKRTRPGSSMADVEKSRGVPLQEVELSELETYLELADNQCTLGNLCRAITVNGFVLWVCLEHYNNISFNNEMRKYIKDFLAMA